MEECSSLTATLCLTQLVFFLFFFFFFFLVLFFGAGDRTQGLALPREVLYH